LPQPNQEQPKTTFIGVVLLSVKKTTTTPHHHHHYTGTDYDQGSSKQLRKLIFGIMQPTTSIPIYMEDNPNFFTCETDRKAKTCLLRF
jgi:hypothetical protein